MIALGKRPKSIVLFERFYAASLVLSLVDIVFLDPADPQTNSLETVIVLIVVLALALAFWFLIAVRASKVAKWAFVALWGVSLPIGTYELVSEFEQGWLVTGLSLTITALDAICIVLLFKRDARLWFDTFKAGGPVDPAVFD